MKLTKELFEKSARNKEYHFKDREAWIVKPFNNRKRIVGKIQAHLQSADRAQQRQLLPQPSVMGPNSECNGATGDD